VTSWSLPSRVPGTELRLLATNDLLGTVLPLPTTYGHGGSVHGVVHLLDQERERGPVLWVDSGDLSVGGASGLFGDRALDDIAELPLAASAAGNHDFDDGADPLVANAKRMGFPVLCADRDVDLPGGALIDTAAGAVGVVGITHPAAHELSAAPRPAPDWPARVAQRAAGLRAGGARVVVGLLHDGATWWNVPGAGTQLCTRASHLAKTTRPWATHVDLILGGHTLGAWTGTVHGVPAGHAHAFAATVLAVDLPAAPGVPTIHRPVRVPAVRPAAASTAVTAIDAAGQRVVGQLSANWVSRRGAERYLPQFVARAMRAATGADASFVPASQLFTQAPLDGTVAALRAGAVTELDLQRLFPFDDRLVLAELLPGELRRLVGAHNAQTDPANVFADSHWWNWARLPAGASTIVADPETVAVRPFVAPLLGVLLRRDITTHDSAAGGRRAVQDELERLTRTRQA
jgi:2',3'-cyclic-nucleotide 2'-phosphodiesterase (5'-nucleotidase family)